jgi:hypothetical protein
LATARRAEAGVPKEMNIIPAVAVALRQIKPDIDADEVKAAWRRIDPDWHRAFFARAEFPYMSRWQITELRKVLGPAVSELRQISPQAWFILRTIAHKNGATLPASPKSPAWPFTPPGLVDHLEALLDAADELGRPPRGHRPGLRVERAVAGACAAVFFDLRRDCPTTSHPDQRVASVDPYHALVEAVFEGGHFDNWEDRAKEAASELRAVILGSQLARKSEK